MKCFLLFSFLFIAAECAICPSNYVAIDNLCFRFYPTPATWDDARATCKADGADLAILDNCKVFGDVASYIPRNGLDVPDGSFYWIGARDEAESIWVWVDGSTVEMGAPFWGSDATGTHQPDNGGDLQNEDCAYLDKADQYYFHDGDCALLGWFICQK